MRRRACFSNGAMPAHNLIGLVLTLLIRDDSPLIICYSTPGTSPHWSTSSGMCSENGECHTHSLLSLVCSKDQEVKTGGLLLKKAISRKHCKDWLFKSLVFVLVQVSGHEKGDIGRYSRCYTERKPDSAESFQRKSLFTFFLVTFPY